MDPRIAAGVIEAVDTRFDQLRRAQPYRVYGTVAAVDTVNLKCSVYVSGDPAPSAGFSYPLRMVPAVGERVRVAIDPRGDRYVEEVYGPARATSLTSESGMTARSIELRWAGGTPYIDFSNDAATDFDARLILAGDNTLELAGADLSISGGSLSSQMVNPWYSYGSDVLPSNMPLGMSMWYTNAAGWPGASGIVIAFNAGNSAVLQMFVTNYTGGGATLNIRQRNDFGGWTAWKAL